VSTDDELNNSEASGLETEVYRSYGLTWLIQAVVCPLAATLETEDDRQTDWQTQWPKQAGTPLHRVPH